MYTHPTSLTVLPKFVWLVLTLLIYFLFFPLTPVSWAQQATPEFSSIIKNLAPTHSDMVTPHTIKKALSSKNGIEISHYLSLLTITGKNTPMPIQLPKAFWEGQSIPLQLQFRKND